VCGCFGGRGRPAWQLLTRNAALGALAASAALGTADASTVRLPGAPGPGELLPMILAIGGLAVAAIALARTAWWLGRGRA
jgi:hypothetical protein